MSDNVIVNGTLMGAAGAGAGYLYAAHQTEGMRQAVSELSQEVNLLKQPIIDQFEKYGYKEGMDIGKAVQDKVNKNYAGMWSNGAAYETANSEKALGKIWNREFAKLKNLETTFKTKMQEFAVKDNKIKELTEKIGSINKKYIAIGAGVGVGLVVLNKIRKAIFGGNKA